MALHVAKMVVVLVVPGFIERWMEEMVVQLMVGATGGRLCQGGAS